MMFEHVDMICLGKKSVFPSVMSSTTSKIIYHRRSVGKKTQTSLYVHHKIGKQFMNDMPMSQDVPLL